MGKPTYSKIIELRKQLDGAATKSRTAGDRLVDMLSDAGVRRRLANEAAPDNPRYTRVAAYQRKALSQMWRVLIQSAIAASKNRRTSGKSKYTVQDAEFPFKLLKLCNFEDELFDSNCCKLKKEEIKLVFNYCMESLEDDKIMAIDGIERVMFDMLAYICSRREFVATLKPIPQISSILEEIEKKLLPDEEIHSVDTGVVRAAANSFGNLLSTCQDLGITMSLLLPGTIKMVSDWCTENKTSTHADDSSLRMIPGVTILLRSNPDLSVAPLTRYGRPILSWVKRRLLQHKTVSLSSNYVSMLLEYILQHLLVCQTAGKLQGLIPGDLGDIGRASLSFRSLSDVLECLIEGNSQTMKFDAVKKLRLEVIARLLACTQRVHIRRQEWRDEESLNAIFLEHKQNQRKDDDFYRLNLEHLTSSTDECNSGSYADSPFASNVLRHIVCPSSETASVPTSRANKQLESQSAHQFHDSQNSTQKSLHPLLADMDLSVQGCSTDERTLVSMLQVIGAAAEILPLGACWASCTSNNWKRVSVEVDSGMIHSTVNGGLVSDLAAVVDVVCGILIAHGGYSASERIQEWSLNTLQHLAVATAAHIAVFPAVVLRKSSLYMSWRRVWTSLLRLDLVYRSHTKSTVLGSLGDSVVRLLIQIVRFECTGSNLSMAGRAEQKFLARGQVGIWSLAAFEQRIFGSSATLMLLYVILQHCGLSEEGLDRIGGEMAESDVWKARMESFGRGRRSRLLCFCFQCLDVASGGQRQKRIASTASACIAALVNGFGMASLTIFSVVDGRIDPCLSFHRIVNDNRSGVSSCSHYTAKTTSCVHLRIWSDPLKSLEDLLAPPPTSQHFDIVEEERRQLYNLIFTKEPKRMSKDSVGTSTRSQLFACSTCVLRSIVKRQVETDEPKTPYFLLSVSLKLKAHLTLILLCVDEISTESIESALDCVAFLFQATASQVDTLCDDQEMLTIVLSDLINIERVLLSFSPNLQMQKSSAIAESSRCLYEMCGDILSDYVAGHVSSSAIISSISTRLNSATDNLSEDDSSDDTDANASISQGNNRVGQKRKRRSSTRKMKCVSRKCCYYAAVLFLDLNPSLADCLFVAKTLVGVDDLFADDNTNREVDALGGVLAVAAMCSKKIVTCAPRDFRNPSSQSMVMDEGMSAVNLICQVLCLIRQASDAHSITHLFGYFICAEIVCMKDQNAGALPFSTEEVRNVKNLFFSYSHHDQERRSLLYRPWIRANRLKAATLAFETAGDFFHFKFDSEFASILVLPSLSDVSCIVRFEALRAVAAAMTSMDQEKVATSVLRRLAPVSKQSAECNNAYREWYASKSVHGGSGSSSSTVECQVWEDVCNGIMHDVVTCWSVIAGILSSGEMMKRTLFNIVHLAKIRPEFEGLCFKAVDQVAVQKGLELAETLLDVEVESLTQRWIILSFKLFDMPLLITAPMVYRKILLAGQCSLLTEKLGSIDNSNRELEGHHSHILELKKDATKAFLARYSDVVIPQIFLSVAATLDIASAADDREAVLLNDDRVKEVACVCFDTSDAQAVKKLILARTDSILASCCCYYNFDTAEKAILLLKNFLSNDVFHRKCDRIKSLAVRKTIKIMGEGRISPKQLPQIIPRLADLLQEGRSDPGDETFINFGSNTTELIIYAKFRLDNAASLDQINQRWSALKYVLDTILETTTAHPSKNCQLNFCLITLLDIAMNRSLAFIRIDVLRSLRLTLVKAGAVALTYNEDSKLELATTIREVFCSILEMHRESQTDFMVACETDERARAILLLQRNGVVDCEGSDRNDLCVWTDIQHDESSLVLLFRQSEKTVSRSISERLEASFEIVQVILNNGAVFGIKNDVLAVLSLECEEKERHSALYQINSKFAAQLLIPLSTNDDIQQADEEEKFAALVVRVSSQNVSNRFIRADLMDIEREIRRSKTQTCDLKISKSQYSLLVKCLLDLCGHNTCNMTRVAASRCLGELNLPIESTTESPTEVFAGSSFSRFETKVGLLPVYLHVEILESLASMLSSSDSRKAILSTETFKAAMASKTSKNYRELIEASPSLVNLRPLLQPSVLNPPRALMLSNREISVLSNINGIACKLGDDSWCWNELLWTYGASEDVPFEAWITRLVPALLVCCYQTPKDSNPSSDAGGISNDFFFACQRLSCLDSSFAKSLFPALVLELILASTADDSTSDSIRQSTWIGSCSSAANIQFSRCFSFFLEKCSAKTDPETLDLVIDVLDLLRRYMQHRFMLSPPDRSKQSVKLTNITSYDDLLKRLKECVDERKTWRGIPFGTVLSLGGAIVAKTCILARRFEQALFYAELFGESRFRGRCFSEMLCMNQGTSDSVASSRNIGGYGIIPKGEDDANHWIERDVLTCIELFRTCFSELDEPNDVKAVDQLESDFSFTCSKDDFLHLFQFKGSPTFERLQILDNLSMHRATAIGRNLTAECLGGLGLHNTLESFVAGSMESFKDISKNASLREKFYEARLYKAQWTDELFLESTARLNELNASIDHSGQEAGYYELVFGALTAYRSDDLPTSKDKAHKARLHLIEVTSSFGANNAVCSGLYDTIEHFQTLNDLEDCLTAESTAFMLDRFCLLSSNDHENALQSRLDYGTFSNCVREVVLRSAMVKPHTTNDLSKNLSQHLSRQLQSHIESRRIAAAEGTLQRLSVLVKQEMSAPSNDHSFPVLQLRLKEAALLELRGDFSGSIRMAKLVIRSLRQRSTNVDVENQRHLAKALTVCGKWMAKHKVEPANTILSNYLQPAVSIYGIHSKDTGGARDALLALSQLASTLFDSLSARVSSSEWRDAGFTLDNLEKQRNDLKEPFLKAKMTFDELSPKQKRSSNLPEHREYVLLLRSRNRLCKMISATRTERKEILRAMEDHHVLAMNSIVSALSIAGRETFEDLSKYVYRLVALWFSNDTPNKQQLAITKVMRGAVDKVPTFRFVPLMAQLLSRLDKRDSSDFQECLCELLVKMTTEHPYHCLIQLITISRSDNSLAKSKAATLLVEHIRGNDDTGFLSELTDSYQILADAYLHLAMLDTKKYEAKGKALLSACGKDFARLDLCLGGRRAKRQYPPCIFTAPPMLRSAGDYGDGCVDPIGSERVATFEAMFSLTTSGIHRPRIVVCIGSRGGKYKQLVKGHDDIRKDAVMEQVFGYVNDLMIQEQRSNAKRKLMQHRHRLVTYNVVPLCEDAGVLEWVGHSIPIGDYIFKKGGSGAHQRYFPDELRHGRCYEVFGKVRNTEDTTTTEQLRAVLDILYHNHSPAFRFFFVEKFGHQPQIWYECKMRYTRSVAVSSIVGHILGIGDRHLSNILVHQQTGEVIHIDFGIVFEQGKELTIPELIPFRLTRNIVDGMGPLGTEGTFLKTAETTMSALKQNKTGLLTILSAVVSDPSYNWKKPSLATETKNRIGDDESRFENTGDENGGSIGNELAYIGRAEAGQNEKVARTIARVHEKLQGYEDGTSGEQQSVESQVQLLVSAARDPDNLCRIYHGWAPWS